ncbi:MAG TPA: hypothetical protein VGZ47_08690 [Gemmataceae bacterium]|jgi:hypothetical protein|nr:hypothetical protein [Gemmataceae bacterium]
MWEQFFLEFFDCSAETISVVLDAWGCREGWLQGELYRAGWRRGLRVNEYSLGGSKKADICCLEPPKMVGEIKIVGADHKAAMRDFLDEDVRRLGAIDEPGLERFMILVVPKSDFSSRLGDYLSSVCFSSHCVERDYKEFKLRLWRLDKSAASA